MSVSTIIPVLDRSALLRESADSILAQTYRLIEIVIVDDGSTDDTPRVGKELEAANPGVVRYVRQENAGPGVARNTGLRLARGEFIQYLDSDDLLEPRKFELQVAALQRHPEAGVCYCTTLRANRATGRMEPWARTAERIENIYPEFLMKRGWATLTPLWRRSACEKIGPWGDFRVMEDWEHDLRAGMLGVKTVHVPEPLAIVRDHGGDRASGMSTGFTPELTRHFFEAHRSICHRMREYDLPDWSHLEPFTRKMFWIARMCGQRGLAREASEALDLAIELTETHRPARKMKWFRTITRLCGWRATANMSEAGRGFVRCVVRGAA